MSLTESEQHTVQGEAEIQAAPLAVYYHTHWDREWYLPFRSYQLRLATVVDDILQRLENGHMSCFMLDGQTVVLQDYLELRPHQAERLRTWIERGQLRIGPWYVMPDEFLVGGESLIRNLVMGIRQSRTWGCQSFTGYLPDTFGHSADMPTLFQNSGIQSAVVWRGVQPRHSIFLWQSPAGDRVKTLHLTDGYFQMMLQDWTADAAAQTQALQRLVEKLRAVQPSLQTVPLLPLGGDHLGPLPAEAIQRLRALYPRLQETTPDAYLAAQTPSAHWETLTGELTDNRGSFLLPGVYSSRLYLKQANRILEHLLTRQLEPLLAMAQGLGVQPPELYPSQALALTWQTLLLNHPHDSICGCSVDAVHRENEVRFEQVAQLEQGLKHQVVQAFREHCATPDQWLLFNTGGRPYTGVVWVTEDVPDVAAPSLLTQVASEETVLQDEYWHDTQRIPLSHLRQVRRQGWIWAESIPALGVATVAQSSSSAVSIPDPVSVHGTGLSNGQLKVAVGASGRLRVEVRSTGQCFENLVSFSDRLDQGDSYNSGPVPEADSQWACFMGSRVLQSGPLVGILELTHHFQASDLLLVTQVRLQAGSALLAFETTFINHTSQHKLQAVFQTGGPVETVWAESHLGLVQRQYDPNYREADLVPVSPQQELPTNTGPIQRFLSANGQGWITEGLCEYEIYQQTLGITLLRAFGALSSADTGVRGAQAGPPFETPEGQCLGRTFRTRYAWVPSVESPECLFELADRFYGTVWGVTGRAQALVASPAQSLLTLESPQLVTMACYWLPGQGLILRALNPTGQAVRSAFRAAFVYQALWETNFLEEPQQQLLEPVLTVPAWGVKTWLFAV